MEFFQTARRIDKLNLKLLLAETRLKTVKGFITHIEPFEVELNKRQVSQLRVVESLDFISSWQTKDNKRIFPRNFGSIFYPDKTTKEEIERKAQVETTYLINLIEGR